MKIPGNPQSQRRKDESPQRLDVRLMKPGKYETNHNATFTVDVYLRRADKRWVVMSGPGEGIEHEEVVFRLWGYDEMVEMRKMATTYDQKKRLHMIDHDLLNRLKIQRLLVSWTFGVGNQRLKLHHVNGVMVDESWDAFKNLSTNIIEYIAARMNDVYERNR